MPKKNPKEKTTKGLQGLVCLLNRPLRLRTPRDELVLQGVSDVGFTVSGITVTSGFMLGLSL